MQKYPFTPELLDALPEELAELFRSLEATLLDEICTRLNLKDQLNEVTVQAIRALRSQGIELDEVKKAIRRTSNLSEQELDELISNVLERNQAYYAELIDFAGLTQPEALVDAAAIDAIRRQTQEEFHNLTQSMGFLVDNGRTMLRPAKAYQWALDNAAMQIESGAVDYNQAVQNAVKQLASSGLKVVSYESGHVDQADVAARRAVMTGVNQLCDQYANQSAEYLNTRYFEVSAHSGARDKPGRSPWASHKDWQGKVYYQSEHGEPDPRGEFKDLVETTGCGYVDGLTGANCRHHKSAFIPGVMERTYTDNQLKHIDDGLGCDFEGQHYTAYEATQMQRRLERTIRKQKRLRDGYKAAGLEEDSQAANIKLRRLKSKYSEFSEAAGLPEQPERMKVLRSSAAPSAPGTPAPAPKYIDVTAAWRESATPNSHAVLDASSYTRNGVTYKVDGHNVVLDYSPHEKEIAELLEKEFGGELYMVPRVNNPKNVSTPDYLFRGVGYDLKTIGKTTGKNPLFNRVKNAKGQASNFVLDITDAELHTSFIDEQIDKVFWSNNTKFVDTVILIKSGRTLKIIKRV